MMAASRVSNRFLQFFLVAKRVQPPLFATMIHDEMVTAGHEFFLDVELALDLQNPDVATSVTWWKNNCQISSSGRVEVENF